MTTSLRVVCLAVLCSRALFAAEAVITPHPLVAGFERFHATAGNSDAVSGGLLLLGELNCVSCHQGDEAIAALVQKKQAPILDEVGSRVRPEFLREFLMNPQRSKPGTTMPNLFAGTADEERAQKVEALVHFLASTGQLLEAGPISPAIRRGEKLFHEVGCVACHNPRREKASPLAHSIPLPEPMEAKYSLPSLIGFLKEPLHTRPSGRMPELNLSDEEARDMASFLLRNLQAEGQIEYAYYEGDWQKLPDFKTLSPAATGKTTGFDVNVGQPNHFAVVFKATMRAEKDGKYTFHLSSDDGSRLKIDGQEVISLDGIHAMSSQSGSAQLQAGLHTIEAEYFEQGGEQELRIEFQGPGIKRQALEFAVIDPAPRSDTQPKFAVDAGLAETGRQLFQSLGCASCHQLRMADQLLASTKVSRPLRELSGAGGCLSPSPRGVPDFQLSEQQRTTLTQALEAWRGGTVETLTSAQSINATMTAFNCYACHVRGEVGGVEEPRNALFLSNQPEMGDEGRIPPHLNGVGAKLKPEWLRRVFDRGAKDRPYMFTRMPKFGVENVGHLTAAFQEADPAIAQSEMQADNDHRHLLAAGRMLVGAEGFSCIKCHIWGKVPSTGIQSIDMTTMARRLNEDWFQSYMLDPQVYRPGTRMPAAWPQGQVLLPNLLDGKAATQIHAVWRYLRDGDQAVMPIGLGSNPIVLTAYDETVVYRNFIEGAGPRAIGVGYPEQVNLAFDANNLRVALLWHGAFIDASLHWQGRGSGFQSPLGDNILKLPDAVSFAVLDSSATPWPTKTAKELGYHFRGYRLGTQRRPTFLYSVHDVQVEDELEPIGKEPFTPVRRSLSISSSTPAPNLWYRAAVGQKIESAADDWYTIDGSWKVRVTDSARLRESAGQVELLVPVQLQDGKARIEQEYVW